MKDLLIMLDVLALAAVGEFEFLAVPKHLKVWPDQRLYYGVRVLHLHARIPVPVPGYNHEV